jgi:predicted Zn-dependent protease with MMP-like domain
MAVGCVRPEIPDVINVYSERIVHQARYGTVERERFQELVFEALEGLPREFRERLENIVVAIEDWPHPAQLAGLGIRRRQNLLGLYEGVPLTKRSVWHPVELPDKITIFQKPIEMRCRSDEEIMARIQETVRHEIAHYFGISDKRLREIRVSKEEEER